MHESRLDGMHGCMTECVSCCAVGSLSLIPSIIIPLHVGQFVMQYTACFLGILYSA